MTAYAFVTISLNDRDKFAEYRGKAGEFMAKHNVKAIAVSSDAQVIEGGGSAPDISVILEFPDHAHALAWINDPEAAHVHELRRDSGESRIILL